MDLKQGQQIQCPICNSHITDIHLNKLKNPFIVCPKFKSICNYNSLAGRRFIENLVENGTMNNPDEDSLFSEDNDGLFSGFGESDNDGLLND